MPLYGVRVSALAACNALPVNGTGTETGTETSTDGGYMPPPEEGENVPDGDTPTADIAVPCAKRKADDPVMEREQYSRL